MSGGVEACPFCGGEASLTIPSELVVADCADIYVACDECESEGQHIVVEMRDRGDDLWPDERREAIAAWNTRTAPPARTYAEGVEDAAKICDERAAGRARMYEDNQAGINAFKAVEAEEAAAAIRLLSQGEEKTERYRHVKRGTVYEVIGRAQLQIATGDVCEGSELVIYRGDDGKLWARESGEFNDGRFKSLVTSRSQHEGADNG